VSGPGYQPDAWRRMSPQVEPKAIRRLENLGMSPRQQSLNRRWSYYCCSQYDTRQVDWDGTPCVDEFAREAIASAGYIPPGFYDAGGQTSKLPLKFRRPSAPYHLARAIVHRFTGLLFSERQHPQVRMEGDPTTEDFARALAEVSRLWPAMILARNYGGATGTAVLTFQFSNGLPLVEVHDPRWVTPYWRDRQALDLEGLEIRYQYPIETRDPESGLWVTIMVWYRRVIDTSSDVVYEPEMVGQGDEPAWRERERVDHGLGFFPGTWIQNLPVVDDVDGEPDAHGVFDTIEEIDQLQSQAIRGTKSNCDPTATITTDREVADLRKGSDNALVLEKGGGASYMEISGSGPKSAMDLVGQLRSQVLEVAQCVLDHPDTSNRTATEIERVYSSMLSKADVLREQYGERGVKRLIDRMVRAARALGEPRADAEGNLVRSSLVLPPRFTGEGKRVERRLGAGGTLKLQWPGYFEPSVDDAQKAVTAAVSAKGGGVIDDEVAVHYVAPYFRVEDARAMLDRVRASQVSEQAELEAMALGALPREEQAAPPAEGVKFFQYEIEGGIVTINEVRASKGLGPIEDGDLTLPQYRAKYVQIYATSTLAESPDAAERVPGVAAMMAGGGDA